MPFVRANPNQYLLTGRRGKLVNRGSAVQTFLTPGTVWVLVPSTKQEAEFAFTQETKDGIPLRFKGVVIYRITEPLDAAQAFDFHDPAGVEQISTLLTHIALGELRHAVSHMTMAECIEQRKTTLTQVVRMALESTIRGDGEAIEDWGISVEVAQVAQVFIVDGELRQKLEARVRNEIRLQSEKSEIQTSEEARLTAMASEDRVAEQKLAADREDLRRREELHAAELAAEEARIEMETPVQLLRLEREGQTLRDELAVEELRSQVRALEVERDQLLARSQQELRREILPIEQAPEVVRAAAGIFREANLSIYGEDAQLLGQLAPLFDLITHAARQAAVAGTAEAGSN